MSANRLRRGIYLPPFGPFGDAEVLVDLAVRAESAGWDGMFLWDHVVSDMSPIADGWTALAAMAVETSRIKIGPTVTPVPRRRPWILARQASTVSRLSAGRLVVGVGLGSDESGDFSRFGEEHSLRTRSSMLDAGLEIMRSMWTGEAYTATGPYDVDIPAGAAEPHHIPVWMASSARHRRVLERASRCDGIFPISDHTLRPEELAVIIDQLHALGRPQGENFDVIASGNASPAWETPNPDGVDLQAMADVGATWWMESLIHFDPLEQSIEVVEAGPP